MPTSTPEFIAIFFAILLLFLILALIFRPNFRDAVLGGPGEATIMGILTVKGVVIVLLSALLIGGVLVSLDKVPVEAQPVEAQPAKAIEVRLNVHFEPDEVNPQHSNFNVTAYIKTSEGAKLIPAVDKVQEGSVSVTLEVPDMQTPFFIVFDTEKGTWRTDDFSIHEATATARKQGEVTFP